MYPDPVALLRRHFGYPAFRPGQEELVCAVLGGCDALGVLPTGGGKSVCYQVPAFALGGLVLVITPLVSLMEDQVARAIEVGLRAAHLSGTQSARQRRDATERARCGALDLLFVAPERLDSARFRDFLRTTDVGLLAIDEAHCISEWGHDFRPSYRRIGAARALLTCPTLALTATATPHVRKDIVESLGLDRPVIEVRSFDRPNLSWSVRRPGRREALTRLILELLRATPGCAVVYAPTRGSVDALRDRLAGWGVPAEAYHAGMTGAERSRVQTSFMTDRSRVVVATNAFGMGIDKPDVRLVAHLQLPGTLESYYQEAGRAGRDGQPASCVALFDPRDRAMGRGFIDRTHPPSGRLRRLHQALRRAADPMGIVALADPCLRRTLPPGADAWAAGDPTGSLGALERIGAIRRIAPPADAEGTRPPAAVSQTDRIGVRSRLDLSAAIRLRQRARAKLRAVERFARTRSCRRNALLHYFGEDTADDCGTCDRCLPDSSTRQSGHHA